MASWHKRARLGVAIFGLVVAGLVYFAMRERQTAPAPTPVSRLDPKAILEITAGILQGMTGIEKDFEIESTTFQAYPDGSTKYIDATILVHKGENRTFKVRAKEALAGKDQMQFELTGDVRLEDSDGFFLTTDRATFDRRASIARTPAPVAFGKGRMSGSGVGITYDQANNVLVVSEQAQVTTRDDAGEPVMEFTSGTATLDRMQHRLTVENSVRVDRGEEVIEADRAVGSLSENDDVIRFLELRGNSRVAGGGGGIDAMSARDINLDYTDDGQQLEAVSLNGSAAVARKGQNGAGQQIVADAVDLVLAADQSSRMVLKGNAAVTMMGEQGGAGRRIAANSLELDVATDGSLTRTVGRDRVRLDLPAAADAPLRSIRANTMDGTGEAGKGLTNATFAGDVLFTEERRQGVPGDREERRQVGPPERADEPALPGRVAQRRDVPGAAGSTSSKETATRTARADRLQTVLANDAVTSATFTVNVAFEEAGLKGCAARVEYQPDKGTLALSGATAEGNPIVVEEQIAIEAQTINVALDSRRMIAKDGVTTQVRTPTRCRPATARPATDRGPNRLPGLLKQDEAATITAAALDYEGDAGKALYSGRALLAQGETSIRADALNLDQKSGDLTATGNAMSNMTLDGEESTGRAHEIRYTDAKGLIQYSAPPVGTVLPPVPAGRGPAPAREPQLSGPQVDLTAGGRIEIQLAEGGGKARQIDAYTNVRLRLGERRATGGATLTYYAEEEKYVMTASPSAPLVLVSACRVSRGKTLIFYKANDTIEIDGERERRTETEKASGVCTPTTPTR